MNLKEAIEILNYKRNMLPHTPHDAEEEKIFDALDIILPRFARNEETKKWLKDTINVLTEKEKRHMEKVSFNFSLVNDLRNMGLINDLQNMRCHYEEVLERLEGCKKCIKKTR